jgi:hypothetical protein
MRNIYALNRRKSLRRHSRRGQLFRIGCYSIVPHHIVESFGLQVNFRVDVQVVWSVRLKHVFHFYIVEWHQLPFY